MNNGIPNTHTLPPGGMLGNPSLIEITAKQPFNTGLKISGAISQFKVPELLISFQNNPETKYRAVVDTGAFYCCFSLGVLKDLGLTQGDGYREFEHPNEGRPRSMCFKQSFFIDGVNYRFEELFDIIATAYQYPVIIGSEFLSRCKSMLYLGQENKFEIEF